MWLWESELRFLGFRRKSERYWRCQQRHELPANVCNLGCPECPYRDARHDAGHGRIRPGECAEPDDIRTATARTAARVLEAAAEAGVRGVLITGGGEPGIWEPLPDMLRHSAALGMANGLYTNAVQVGLCPDLAERLLAPEAALVFARVSVNAVSPEVMRRHWGAVPEAVLPQFDGLRALLQSRRRLWPRYRETHEPIPSVQVSTIVDRHNVGDLPLICSTVARIFGEATRYLTSDDVIVIRPLTLHGRGQYSNHDHEDWVINAILAAVGRSGPGRRMLEESGLKVHLGFGLDRIEAGEASLPELVAGEYRRRSYSFANGMFLTAGPDGSLYPSTEYNCNVEWKIGDLRTQSVAEVYRSQQRRDVLRVFHSVRWGPQLSQATARTARLDRIARAVLSGELGDEEIAHIREKSLETPALLLD